MPPPDDSPARTDDESARVDIAVRALGDMQRSRPSEGRTASDDAQQQPAGLMSRMSSLPIVERAKRAYDYGKASSVVVKYGASMVESGVKTISKPVIDRLPVNQIDEFACRQLDRLDRYRRPSVGPESPRSPTSPSRTHSSMATRMSDVDEAGPSSHTDNNNRESDRGRPKLRTKTFDGSPEVSEEQRKYIGSVPQWIESTHSARTTNNSSGAASPMPMDDSRIGSPVMLEDRRTRSPEQQNSSSSRRYSNDGEPEQGQNPERQVAQRSRWQAMLLEAGGLGVALSDENMRRLKYCLDWLMYATAHIDAQILILRDLIESIQPLPPSTSSTSSSSTTANRRPPISEEQLRKLTEVRKDIVSTVRQMVDVVSKYAGGALPEPARGRVRGFILKLPQRWASRTVAVGATSGSSTGVGVTGGERETVIAAGGSSTGVLRRGQGRDKRAAQRERGTGSRAASPTPPEYPTHGHSHSHSGSLSSSGVMGGGGQQQQVSHSNATVAAQRILTLATESLDMMRNVTGVVKDSLDRADAWVNRLRMVGVQRGNSNSQDTPHDEPTDSPPAPRLPSVSASGATLNREDYRTLFQTHRRAGSTSSSLPDTTTLNDQDETSSLYSGSTPASPFTTTTSLTSHLTSTSSYSMPGTPTQSVGGREPVYSPGGVWDAEVGGCWVG
ncbi:hypothetical protein NP233_g8296 [Leucocoprinus birnbaumii]|uniref:Opi1-domain-containing protein n=1 Tax=Leucocoprinus birnbaumii TaxID=56174 RepID=A0AAD5VMM7_9AGAR|nr:hypothetical protein NP233_g8296 [Leucocoprinus birnbaumii]